MSKEQMKKHKNVLPCLFVFIVILYCCFTARKILVYTKKKELQNVTRKFLFLFQKRSQKQGSIILQTNIPTGSSAILILILQIALYFLLVQFNNTIPLDAINYLFLFLLFYSRFSCQDRLWLVRDNNSATAATNIGQYFILHSMRNFF